VEKLLEAPLAVRQQLALETAVEAVAQPQASFPLLELVEEEAQPELAQAQREEVVAQQPLEAAVGA
jgi:hypothetical protein